MLSFSTCWNSHRHTDGYPMLCEIRDLGFERVELGHGVRISLLEGVQRALDEGVVKITSLHNFCPLPIEITRANPDCFKYSAADDRERERAVKETFKTIDFAKRFGAGLVVLHLGRTTQDSHTDRLIRMAESGLLNSRGFLREKQDCLSKREREGQKCIPRVYECLKRVSDYAGERGINLGIESRHSYEEIPNEQEMIDVLNEFALPHVGYWHDFGHVQVKHNLGFLDHVQWMSCVAPRLLGCHLHDTEWPGNDHMPPFTGDVPYEELLKLFPKSPQETLFVFEMSPRRERDAIMTAREKWAAKYGA